METNLFKDFSEHEKYNLLEHDGTKTFGLKQLSFLSSGFYSPLSKEQTSLMNPIGLSGKDVSRLKV